jgi:hypothetical protein
VADIMLSTGMIDKKSKDLAFLWSLLLRGWETQIHGKINIKACKNKDILACKYLRVLHFIIHILAF